MAGGLVALVDDVAALARLAAASLDDVSAAASRASVKAAGVVVDDTAVTPRYVQGLRPERELSIIAKIATGSLRNKIAIILPVALILSQYADWLLTPILMLGGTYLSFEGAEKIWEKLTHRKDDEAAATAFVANEKTVVSSAVRTDFILSAEIMVIALNEVADEPFFTRAAILVVVALAITALVYGVVALIVKMDDVGLALAGRRARIVQAIGRGLVAAMPKVLTALANVGIIAMLWVGGHILLVGTDDVGWHGPYSLVHYLQDGVVDSVQGTAGSVLSWCTNTAASALIGLVVGSIVVAIMHLVPRRTKRPATTN